MEELFNKIQAYPYVSFDLFDTLMFRTVSSPEEIFDLVEKKYNTTQHNQLYGFRFERVKAERKARKQNSYNEIKIEDIYNCLSIPKSQKECLMQIEKETEIENCIPNQPMVNILDLCRGRGQKIIITTDMYLDRHTIESILEKIGAEYDTLFISSEEGKTKLSGELFEVVLKRLKINAGNICHIGDNQITDIKKPRERGIQSFERISFPVEADLYKGEESISDIQFSEFVRKAWQSEDPFNSSERIGFAVLGPFIYSFCRWLHSKSEELNPKRLLFVAREGYLLKQIYDSLYPEDKNKSVYIRLNKNMVRRPALFRNPSVEQFLSMVPYRNVYTWKEICDLLFIEDTSPVEKLLKNFGVNSLETQVKHTDLSNVDNSIILKDIFKLIEPDLHRQHDLLEQYIREIGCESNRIFLINNSINGSVQKMLNSFDDTVDVVGIQFVASDNCEKILGNKVIAWFDELGISSYDKMMFGQYSIVLEHLLFEKTGTALYFLNQDSLVEVACEGLREEEANYPLIEQIQKHSVEFVNKYSKWINDAISDAAVTHLFDMLLNPFQDDAILLGGIVDRDYNGATKIADIHAYEHVKAKDLIHDIRDYNKIKWPHGLLKALDLKKEYIFYSKGKLIMYKLKTTGGVYVIIVNYNGYDDTIACLESLIQANIGDAHIVVVDNASTDNSVPKITAYIADKMNRITLLVNSENLGFSGGNNVGIRYALENRAEYVLLLNNDTVVEKDFLMNLMPEASENTVLTGKILFYSKPDKIWYAGGHYNRWTGKTEHFLFNRTSNSLADKDSLSEVNFVSGCYLLIPTKVIKKCGFLPEHYFLYCEDTEFSIRMIDAGIKMYYCPTSIIYHKVGASTGKLSNAFLYYNCRNSLLLIREHERYVRKVIAYMMVTLRWIKRGIEGKADMRVVRLAYSDFYKKQYGRAKVAL